MVFWYSSHRYRRYGTYFSILVIGIGDIVV